jgi:predicted dithiol-disulfide oxidoreductase (DUF899 family)
MEPRIVTRDEWVTARKALLIKEKALTEAHDALAAERRSLPMVRIEKPYRFHTPAGTKSLAELFDGRSQLMIYHFMMGPDWSEGCPSCSFLADSIDGTTIHLAHRDVTLMAVSRAPLANIDAFKRRMGWKFPWASSTAATSTATSVSRLLKRSLRVGRPATTSGRSSTRSTKPLGSACS